MAENNIHQTPSVALNARATDVHAKPLELQVEERFGVLPNFFRLCPGTPEITANLWGFAKAAYLDNPMPSLFKERLFVHLSRFCEVRYCIARHVGFLIGLGRPAGDAESPVHSIEDVVRLLQRPFPRGSELDCYFQLSRRSGALTQFPGSDSDLERAVFAFATHVFLETEAAERCQDELERLFGSIALENLILFLAFVRTAHYWTKVHHKLEFEDDIKELLATHEALANCILNDPEAGAVAQKIVDELPLLRQRADRASSLLSSIVESSDDAIVSKTLGGIITSWNKGAEHLFGYTAEEAIGQHITLIIPPDRHDEEKAIVESLKRGERVDHFETVRRRKDGSFVEISVTISPVRDQAGKVVGASKVAREIGARKRIERALAEQARLLDLSSDAILARDSSDRITYWNNGACEVYGYSKDEAVGQVSHTLLKTVFSIPFDRVLEELKREGRWSGELLHTRKDGRQITVSSRWVLVRTPDGHTILETNNDVTEQKRYEQALRDSKEQLRSLADSLEEKVDLRTQELERRNTEIFDLSMRLLRAQDQERRHIARELHDTAGQTVSVVGMRLQRFVQKAGQASPELANEAEAIRALIEKLNQDIRTASYLLHPPLLDESGLAASLAWYVRGLAERSGLDIRLDIPEDLGRLPQDMELVVFRLVQECLTNIHRHSGSKSAVIQIHRDGGKISVAVADQGKGMTPERLGEVQGHGAGVGFRGMRERVRQFGGEIKIESNGTGTIVSACLSVPEETIAEIHNEARA
jgi:PAS domain S-box-containing protein